jgi:hypothetical protein
LSTEPTGASGAAGDPSEEELRAAYEAELSRITTTDMIAQSAVSLLNLGARKLGPPPAPGAPAEAGADLEQVRDAIDGARALLDILERRIPQEVRPLRDALSQLQMAYARAIQTAPRTETDQAEKPAQGGQPTPGAADAGEQTAAPRTDTADAGAPQQPGPGPAESSGRLWVPGR